MLLSKQHITDLGKEINLHINPQNNYTNVCNVAKCCYLRTALINKNKYQNETKSNF